MLVDRPRSGVDLMTRIQSGGDLQDSLTMFDHVKHVSSWTTIGSHIYDNMYCKVMTIALCDMQSKDAAPQVLFWLLLNSGMWQN